MEFSLTIKSTSIEDLVRVTTLLSQAPSVPIAITSSSVPVNPTPQTPIYEEDDEDTLVGQINPVTSMIPAAPGISLPTMPAPQVAADAPNPFLAAGVPTPPGATVAPSSPSVAQVPATFAVSRTPDGVTVDDNGNLILDPRAFPWDARIHSSAKTRIKKGGFWKSLKGVDKALIPQVEAELRAKGFGDPMAVPANCVVVAHGASDEVEETPQAAVPQAPGVPAAPAAPTGVPAPTSAIPLPTPPAAANPPAPPSPLKQVTGIITKLIGAKKIDAAGVTALLGNWGIKNLGELGQHPDKIPEVQAYFDRQDVKDYYGI